MKTLKYLAFGFAAALGLVAACGDDTGGAATTGTSSNDDGEGGEDGAGGSGSGANGSTGTESTTGTNTGSTGSNNTTSTGSGDCAPSDVENTEELCTDGCDNDGNNFADCDDFDCSDFCQEPGAPAENSNVTCSDGQDNDGNGTTDCDDPGCADRRACSDDPITGESVGGDPNVLCADGINNDGNTGANGQEFTDCGDNSCRFNWEATVCQDLPRENTNAACSDGEDNDLDGQVDCEDSDCVRYVEGVAVAREGIVVCDGNAPSDIDPDDQAAVTEAANAVCSDTLNNDGNTSSGGQPFTDCDDFGCSQNPDVTVCNQESDNTVCDDGLDNDGDSYADCADFSCQVPWVTVCADSLENTFAKCTDGIDNDGNGWTDCDDNACEDNRAACDFPSDEQ